MERKQRTVVMAFALLFIAVGIGGQPNVCADKKPNIFGHHG